MPFPWLRTPRKSSRRPIPLTVEPLGERTLPSATMVTALGHTTLGSLDIISQAVGYNGALYFTATDGHAYGLYRSDGSAAGTALVKSFGSSSEGHSLVVSHGLLFFNNDDGSHGEELWKTDGTAAGTALVKDVNPGAGPSFPSDLTDVNGTLYFVATPGNPPTAPGLWKTDGTASGTAPVTWKGSASAASIYGLTAVNGALFFITRDPSGLSEQLWKTDGTASGTVALAQGAPMTFNNLTNVNGTLFFSEAGRDVPGATTLPVGQLWKTDGTPKGTVKVKDVTVSTMTVVGNTIYFTGDDGTSGLSIAVPQLWKSDGTTAGTVLVKATNSGGAPPIDLTAFRGRLYFAADDLAHGYELWKSDGTAAGTALVKDINPGTSDSLPFALPGRSFGMAPFNGALYFGANDGTHGAELWKTDGTAAGTVLVKDVNPGLADSGPFLLTAVGAKLFFAADDGTHGDEPWVSDGTAAGTHLITDLNAVGAGSSPQNLVNVNGTLFFTAADGALYKSNGTAAGTTLVKDVAAKDLTNFNGTLVFDAYDPMHGSELWKSDGTAAGTVPFATATPPGQMVPYLSDLTVANGLLYFLKDDGLPSLWRTAGTAAGTVDLDPGLKIVQPQQLTAVGGTLFFTALDDVGSNSQLWKSDGTVKGTVLLRDFPAAANDSIPPGVENLTAVKGTLFFTLTYADHGELWKSDGTVKGTVLVKAVSAAGLTSLNGTLYFFAAAAKGDQLWKSDGSAAGTVPVAQTSGSVFTENTYLPIYPVVVNGLLYFFVHDPTSGLTLWKSNGTAAGTLAVKVITPFAFYYPTTALAASGGAVYFTATDTAHGAELWTSDGTAAGATLVQDINPGPNGSTPQELTDVNGTLFFTADDGIHGRELWKVGAAASAGLTAQVAAVKAKDGQPFSGVVATFAHPSGAAAAAYTATITWGDGHTSAGTIAAAGKGTYTVSGAHTYARAGSFALSVKISKAGGATVTAFGTATVADSGWWASRTFERVKKGQAATPVLGTVTDTNPLAAAGDFTVTIDWGDGQTSAGLVRVDPKGGFDVVGTHTYKAVGLYTLKVVITETGGDAVTINPLIAVDP
jgi:ELWxxDGT repeat protein